MIKQKSEYFYSKTLNEFIYRIAIKQKFKLFCNNCSRFNKTNHRIIDGLIKRFNGNLFDYLKKHNMIMYPKTDYLYSLKIETDFVPRLMDNYVFKLANKKTILVNQQKDNEIKYQAQNNMKLVFVLLN